MRKYLMIFFISMVPLVELRGAIPIALGMGLPALPAILVCVLGNILPVPFIYIFARRVLTWGKNKRGVGKICTILLEKGEHAGQKLAAATGRGGLAVALMLFVCVPLPGTGAWSGAMGASFLNMGIKSTVASVSLGVVLAGIFMAVVSLLGLHIFGL